jgi:hypothetical protein
MSLDDPMDWEDSDIYPPKEIDDSMDVVISSMANLLVLDPSCPKNRSSFITDEHGWLAANDDLHVVASS